MQKKYFIIGIVSVIFSWLFASLSIGSNIALWYVTMSFLFGVTGLGVIIFSIAEL